VQDAPAFTAPKELMDKLTAGENLSIVDLRQPMDVEAFHQMIPGALRISMEEIEERHGEIPRTATSFF
jgi:rhodanese-related sulfurtransferase